MQSVEIVNENEVLDNPQNLELGAQGHLYVTCEGEIGLNIWVHIKYTDSDKFLELGLGSRDEIKTDDGDWEEIGADAFLQFCKELPGIQKSLNQRFKKPKTSAKKWEIHDTVKKELLDHAKSIKKRMASN